MTNPIIRCGTPRPTVSKIGKFCKCCAEKLGASDSELFGDGDVSHVDAFLEGEREGWTLRQEYYDRSSRRRCELWDNPVLDKWIVLKFKGRKIKEAMTGDGLDTIRVAQGAL